uniref:CCHC-type domain-containing protein n=1 Tax=Glossina austeni TaxID=7395 RepID=A0A1A9UET5_GLOAU
MPHEAPRETHREYQPVARRRHLPNKWARASAPMASKKRVNTITACRRCAQSGHHEFNCPNAQVLHSCYQQRVVPASQTVTSAHLVNTPCPPRIMLPDRHAAIRRPDCTQSTQLNQFTSTRYNDTYNVQSQQSVSTAAYETSHHEEVNLVKSGFLAVYETSHASPTDKQVDFEEAMSSTSLYSPPVANVDT